MPKSSVTGTTSKAPGLKSAMLEMVAALTMKQHWDKEFDWTQAMWPETDNGNNILGKCRSPKVLDEVMKSPYSSQLFQLRVLKTADGCD